MHREATDMEGPRFHVCLLVFFCANLVRSTTTEANPLNNDHVAFFILGDSVFDVGNNNYLKNPIGLANFTPYGETYFHYPTGRFSDGRLIPDFLAEYMKLPLIPPFLLPGNHQFTDGVNFASGGAGALVETHQGNEGRVVDLTSQVIQLKNVKKQISKQIGDAETKTLFSKAIYLISIGSNEYIAPSTLFKSFSNQDYVGMVIGNLTSAIKDIYKIGGRKFGLIGLGALECSPNMRTLEQNKGGCDEEISTIVKIHNEALPKVLENMQFELEDFQYLYFDLYTTLKERIKNPLKYGFMESKVACCGTGPYRGVLSSCGLVEGYEVCEDASEYVFFDSVHPTEKVYNQVAQLIWSGSNNFTRPHNLKTLLHA